MNREQPSSDLLAAILLLLNKLNAKGEPQVWIE